MAAEPTISVDRFLPSSIALPFSSLTISSTNPFVSPPTIFSEAICFSSLVKISVFAPASSELETTAGPPITSSNSCSASKFPSLFSKGKIKSTLPILGVSASTASSNTSSPSEHCDSSEPKSTVLFIIGSTTLLATTLISLSLASSAMPMPFSITENSTTALIH
ncbi:hypothetical protein MIMGU_mgv1a015247mg [Erythranthe guttata]|uniref:Uncharacterized protein n=1 Tax=Erythranthe guttata TaxID=4155 RepID=A0A022RJR6_ERYGU|nr:hypothetical protein MIMGU_mgv1a015247mg [Erythranthe guttata]